MPLAARPDEVIDPPEKRVPAVPGADHEMPEGPTCEGLNVAPARSVRTTPLVISTRGSVSSTCATASDDEVTDRESA